MLSFLQQYKKDLIFSQNGEEGIILECIKRLGIENGRCVEIGGHDGRYCSNTALLIQEHGWQGKFVETDFDLWQQCLKNWEGNNRVESMCSHVDKYNINAFVNERVNLLSLDTDGYDYKIFQGLKNKPQIIIVEIDSSHLPDENKTNADGGVGYKPMVELGLSKGYFLLAHTGNLIFIDEEYRHLFPEVEGHPIENSELYFNRSWVN